MQTKAVVRLEPEYEVAPDNSDDDSPGIWTGILLALKIEQEPVDKSNTCSYTRRTKTKNGGASAMTTSNTYELEERIGKLSEESLDDFIRYLVSLTTEGAQAPAPTADRPA